jgi:hypothetical protein
MSARLSAAPGPFRPDQVREGDPYELSAGHPVYCLPTGGRGSKAAADGAAILRTDPAVDAAGIETGFVPAPDTLRAPDLSVGNIIDKPGWVPGAPPLAVEYADTGQDETDLAAKIGELMAGGTRHVWVVRMVGPHRVEVHEPGCAVRVMRPGEELLAPGILHNPVPVEALFDWQVGQDVTLRNLLQRKGYPSLDAVLNEGTAAGLRRSLRRVLTARGLAPSEEQSARIEACLDHASLEQWLDRAAIATAVGSVFRDESPVP